jgi:hypothetical protein
MRRHETEALFIKNSGVLFPLRLRFNGVTIEQIVKRWHRIMLALSQ